MQALINSLSSVGVSLCDTCIKADVSCPVYPQDTTTCVEYAKRLDLTPATDDEIAMALEDMRLNGLPPTPSRWMRKFGWSYHKAQDAMEKAGCR